MGKNNTSTLTQEQTIWVAVSSILRKLLCIYFLWGFLGFGEVGFLKFVDTNPPSVD
jgi:hypothetical protein